VKTHVQRYVERPVTADDIDAAAVERCGACEGPLESDRSVICHTCAPESDWFDGCAAVEALHDIGGEGGE
jgi:hypothetical protein